jgi:tetratricopeptide (TPR) repeat protein
MSRLLTAAATAFIAVNVSAQTAGICGPLDGPRQFGPFDYRTATAAQKNIVERAHFTPSVEALQKGNTTVYIGGDIAYTLRVFPNHPRALHAMTRLAKRYDGLAPPGSHYPVECWFDRAIRFRPDDATVRILYALYLIPQGRNDEARKQLVHAEKAPIDAQANYNLGLAYFELKEYDRAVEFARKAYGEGVAFPGLRDKLAGVGKWSASK